MTLKNLNPEPNSRYQKTGNKFGFVGMDHFALPSRDVPRMEQFMCEILGGEPFYYAGFDEQDKKMGRVPHIFVRIGNVLMQCTEPADANMIISKDDDNIAPHWALTVSAKDLDANFERISKLIPVAGPYRHRGVDVVSFYFQSPEGHKIEVCTWDPYPQEKAMLMGSPGVGHIHWPSLAHNWPEAA